MISTLEYIYITSIFGIKLVEGKAKDLEKEMQQKMQYDRSMAEYSIRQSLAFQEIFGPLFPSLLWEQIKTEIFLDYYSKKNVEYLVGFKVKQSLVLQQILWSRFPESLKNMIRKMFLKYDGEIRKLYEKSNIDKKIINSKKDGDNKKVMVCINGCPIFVSRESLFFTAKTDKYNEQTPDNYEEINKKISNKKKTKEETKEETKEKTKNLMTQFFFKSYDLFN